MVEGFGKASNLIISADFGSVVQISVTDLAHVFLKFFQRVGDLLAESSREQGNKEQDQCTEEQTALDDGLDSLCDCRNNVVRVLVDAFSDFQSRLYNN